MRLCQPLPARERRPVARLSQRTRRSLFVLALSLPFLAASCGSAAATGEAKQACARIDRSLKTFERAQAATSPALKAQLTADAQAQLLSSLSLAAQATSSDGSFNALMTTVSEANRVPEQYLVPALRRQCKVIESNTPYLTQEVAAGSTRTRSECWGPPRRQLDRLGLEEAVKALGAELPTDSGLLEAAEGVTEVDRHV